MWKHLVLLLLVPFVLGASKPVAETPHFRFFGIEGGVNKLAPIAEQRYRKICAQLPGCDAVKGRIDVWIAEDAIEFAKQFGSESPITEWAAGVAFPREGRIILRAYGTALFSLLQTFDHEVSHILVHRTVGGRRLPRWFLEGLAIWQASESLADHVQQAVGASLSDRLMPFQQLTRGFPVSGTAVRVAYAQSALFVRWLVREHGEESLRRVLGRVRQGDDFNSAFVGVYRRPLDEAVRLWTESLEEAATPWYLLRDGTVFWVLMALLFLVAFLVTRRRRKAAIAVMAEEEAVDEAWRQIDAERRRGPLPTLH